jgi:phospholipid transport system transporter-binding protein
MYEPTLPLTMQGAETALTEGMREIEAGETSFDLAATTVVDSVSVAILLAWQRAGQMRGGRLEFRNLPIELRSLATLYGVAELLGFAPEVAKEYAPQRH